MIDLAPGIVVADRFRLVHELGRGGMGAVWRAHHVGLNVPCAIKFILGEAAQASEIRSRFEQEAQAAAQLRSPHVVQILDHGVWNGSPYIAMELLVGEDLEKRLSRSGRLALTDVAAIVAQVARALGKAHAAGLVHRDLKPANIFLCSDDDGEIVKILDFGIAKQTLGNMGGSQTKTGALLGTPYYMSPEQARGVRSVDWRSDLWSLGVIVYQCVTGRLPFESDAFGDLLVRIMFNPLPVPSQIAPVPPAFDAFWARAAAREPEARFQSAREMAEALAHAAGVPFAPGEPLSRLGAMGPMSGAAPSWPGVPVATTPMPPLAPPTLPSGGVMGASTLGARGAGRSSAWMAVFAVVLLAAGAGVAALVMRGPSGAPATPPITEAPRPPVTPEPTVTPSATVAVLPSATAAPSGSASAPAVSSAPAAPAPSAARPLKPFPTVRPATTKPRYDDGI